MTAPEAKPSQKWPEHRKLQRRAERYASAGLYCRDGHPWSDNERFNHRDYRYCFACTKAKAEARKNDPRTYTGMCPKGHAYTQENTLITPENAKVCLACKRTNYNKGRSVSAAQIEALLAKAREGATANVLVGKRPSLRRKKVAIVDQPTLLNLLKMQTPECVEPKQLLDKNSFRGRQNYRWNEQIRALLTVEVSKSHSFERITQTINEKFQTDFSVAAVMTKACKIGIARPVRRILIPRTPSLPPITVALRFPIGSLLDRINGAVPRHLARDHRDDVIGEMALAVYDGRLEETDIERRVREFVNAGYRREHDKFGPASLDQPLFYEGSRTLGDTITTGIWQ